MADMEKTAKAAKDTSSFGESHSYFTKNVLPNNIQAMKRKISMPSSYVHNEDQTFLLVTSGTGTMTVNGVDYPLRPNILVNLSPFHVYRFTPEKGHALEITEAMMNSGTYLYLIANPYYKLKNFSVPSEPPMIQLRGLAKDIAYQAMDGLLMEYDRDSWDKHSLCFCYMTDLFGLITGSRPMARKQTKK